MQLKEEALGLLSVRLFQEVVQLKRGIYQWASPHREVMDK